MWSKKRALSALLPPSSKCSMTRSRCPRGLAARAPATPALSSVARLSQPVSSVQSTWPTGHRIPLRISLPIETMSTGVPCAAKAWMTRARVALHRVGELGEVLALPRRGDVLVLGVGPEVRVVDVEVELVPGGLDPLGHLRSRGEVAVAGGRVDPQAQPHVVQPVVVEDRQRRAGSAAVGEVARRRPPPGARTRGRRRARGSTLDGIWREQPELPDARRRAVVVGDVDLHVARAQRPVQRPVLGPVGLGTDCCWGWHRRERVGVVAGADVGQRRRRARAQRDAEAVERAHAAEVDGDAARPLRWSTTGSTRRRRWRWRPASRWPRWTRSPCPPGRR